MPICQAGYDVLDILGCGSLTIVYRVAHRSDGQEFAAKRLKAGREEHRHFLLGEYDIMRGLDHESILRAKSLLDFQTDLWLCVELCQEGSVQSYVEAHGAFTEGQCGTLARQLVDGLEYLHGKRVVHGDLKPQNLLLGARASRLKIGDFNSARRVGARAGGREAVWMLSMRGTCLYCAPEVRFDLPWNERVDIWAMGLSVYFMAQAGLPFDVGKSSVTKALRKGKLPAIPWKGMSTDMADFVQQCLTVDMRDRPTAMELRLHPAFVAMCGERDGGAAGAAGAARSCQGESESTVANSCGLLFSCAQFQTPLSRLDRGWRSTALLALASKNFATLERLPSLGVVGPWMV